MSASLIVEPGNDSESELDRSAITDALIAADVVFGVDEAKIDELMENWKQCRRRYEIRPIASGIAPKPAEEGKVRMLLRHLTTREECDKVRSTRYYWECAASHHIVDRAYAGKEIAEKQIGRQSVPGKNIHGLPVFTDEIILSEIILEDGARFSDDKQKIIAEVDGIAYQIDKTIGVIPVDFNGTFEIDLVDNNMTALCFIHPPGPGGSMPSKEELFRLMEEKGVCAGILEDEIEKLCDLCKQGKFPYEPVVVARGTPPVDGINGKVEFLFNTKTSLSPVIDNEGRADYKSVNIVNTVKAAQKLATIVPPTAGTDGIDVLGNRIAAKPGAEAKLPQGPNTKIENGSLIAEVDGVVRISAGVVEVSEGFLVPGDVDYSTGNIHYEKSVIINGDIKAGFEVKCGGDLQVNGTIEDCHVKAGGSVLCRYGFVGQGRGVIEAKGDVNIGFIKNQKVRCLRNVVIAKEAVNCTILSRDKVEVHGNPLSVVGGEVKAGKSITVYSAGNHSGIRTLLEAGFDFLMSEELALLEEQYKNAKIQYNALAEKFKLFSQTIAGRKHLSSIEQKRAAELGEALKQAKQQLTVLEERKFVIAGKVHSFSEAYIRIEHCAFPGTLFKFGERHYLVKEEIAGPKNIRYIEHEIKII